MVITWIAYSVKTAGQKIINISLSFKEYLIEEDRIATKLRNIEQRLEAGEEEKADIPSKQDKKFRIDRNRYGKMAPKARGQAAGDSEFGEFGDPEGMKTAGGPGFSG